MKREEAIDLMNVIVHMFEPQYDTDRIEEAVEMAIKALKKEPCKDWHDVPSDEMTLEQARQAVRDLRKFVMDNHILPKLQSCEENMEDLISRKAVLNLTKELRFNSVKGMEDYCYRCIDPNDVEDLPPIQPKTKVCKWITYDYRTFCPKEHDVDNPYWRIPENHMDTLKYCPYCGGKIEVE